MTLIAVIADILRYFTEFGRFGGQLRHSGWSWTHTLSSCNRNV